MQKLTSLALALSALVATVSAHGVIASPSPRAIGPAMKAACGEEIFNNLNADDAGNIQQLEKIAKSIKPECHLWQCRGYQFADNKANVHSFSLGEVVPIKVKIVAKHTGYANVSIVDTASNSIIGRPLISWESYASTAIDSVAKESDFTITIPSDLKGCTTAGDCVIQWFWYAPPGVDQTYESCIDFTVGGNPYVNPKVTDEATTTTTTTPTGDLPTTTPTDDLPTTTPADEYPTTTPADEYPITTPTKKTTPDGADFLHLPNTFLTRTTPTGGCGRGRRNSHHTSKY